MAYKVVVLSDAEKDILDIYQYILIHDSSNNIDYVFDKIEEACLDLEELPERGHIPPELDRVGVTVYREIHFKPHRIIYEIDRKMVFIHCVLDGRRDLQQLLERLIPVLCSLKMVLLSLNPSFPTFYSNKLMRFLRQHIPWGRGRKTGCADNEGSAS